MNTYRVIIVTLAMAAETAGLVAGSSEDVAKRVAARLSRLVENNPEFAGTTSVHRNGAQVVIWVLDTTPAAARADLARVAVREGKPLQVKLLDLKLDDRPIER
jgi:hypothetical protein